MSTNWTAVEDAIHSVIVSASGLDGAHVIWDRPNASRPAGAFIKMQMGPLLSIGVDEVVGSDNLGGVSGVSDYTQTVIGRRQFTLTVQCFEQPGGGKLGVPTGTNSAQAVLSRVLTALALPANMDALAAVGVSCFDPGSADNVPELVGTAFEGRAIATPRFNALETVSANTTYIATVNPIGATFNH